MKRLTAVSLVLLVMLSLASCGRGEELTGRYDLTSAVYPDGSDRTIRGEYITLEKDGTGILFTFNIEGDITWENDDNAIAITEPGMRYDGFVEDGVIVFVYDRALLMFTKDGVKEPSIGDYYSKFEEFEDLAA